MKLSTPVFAATTLLGAGLLALSAPLAASAHVEVEPSSTAAGSYSLLTFSVGHGCDGSATTGITIDIPDTITSVTPTVNPGWTAAKVAVDLATPLEDGEGDTITTRVGQVTYTADAPLADGYRTTFALSLQIPADAVGKTLSFPVLQTCEVGSTSWSDAAVEGEAEPAHPAPALVVTEATAEAGHGHGGTEASADDADASTPVASDDVLARLLGIGGLVVGAVGLVVAVASRRKNAA
ncbi:YcnI family protein [Cryobacterium arcticum]|uniref:Nuclear export factor GLE1 n=1 Tax=Cryobacterium arcticum TaxID=670052 RepID=A0A1B1BNN0_9MICO|nr:YcnI family protein [Cryobacterium arcticum]ANP74118.1 nuclear export factor GLE1 [Cryobacterium arcticum]